MPRSILIGDVHGCADELEALLDRVAPGAADRVVFVGDLVVRGPRPAAVLHRVRSLGAESVRGNHEGRLLRLWARDPALRGPADASPIASATFETARQLTGEDWAWLAALPLWLPVTPHPLVAVHAGVMPGRPLRDQEAHVLMQLRGLNDDGTASYQRQSVPWGVRYQGPPHIVFGHNARPDPQLHPWATGLDTGCVYGGRLTAMVLAHDEPIPPPEARAEMLVSVPARKAYVTPGLDR